VHVRFMCLMVLPHVVCDTPLPLRPFAPGTAEGKAMGTASAATSPTLATPASPASTSGPSAAAPTAATALGPGKAVNKSQEATRPLLSPQVAAVWGAFLEADFVTPLFWMHHVRLLVLNVLSLLIAFGTAPTSGTQVCVHVCASLYVCELCIVCL
jgi:hypothetical protein